MGLHFYKEHGTFCVVQYLEVLFCWCPLTPPIQAGNFDRRASNGRNAKQLTGKLILIEWPEMTHHLFPIFYSLSPLSFPCSKADRSQAGKQADRQTGSHTQSQQQTDRQTAAVWLQTIFQTLLFSQISTIFLQSTSYISTSTSYSTGAASYYYYYIQLASWLCYQTAILTKRSFRPGRELKNHKELLILTDNRHSRAQLVDLLTDWLVVAK